MVLKHVISYSVGGYLNGEQLLGILNTSSCFRIGHNAGPRVEKHAIC